ncbi:MAG: phosphodiester glycosidase family protein, partial [Bacillota bacterium]
MRKLSWQRALLALILSLLLLLSQTSLVHAALPTLLHEDVQTESIAKGVTYERHLRFDAGGWLAYHIIRVDMSSSSIRIDELLAGNKVSTPAALSQMAEAQGAIAAINGDFFFIGETGSPLGPVIKDGQLISTPSWYPEFATLGISQQGIAQIGYWGWSAAITHPNGKRMAVDGLNKQGASYGLPIVYNSSWGRPTPGSPKPGSSHLELVVKNGKVAEIRRDQSGVDVPADAYVVVGRDAAAAFLSEFKMGDAVKLEYTTNPDWRSFKTAIGGGSMLVKDGKVAEFTHVISGSQPRSAVGISRDGKTLWLVAVDGRAAISRGLTQTELAEMLIDLGAYQALNLDGGGSTTMVTRTLEQPVVVRNRPSDGTERRIPNGLAVFATAPKGALAGLRLTAGQDVLVVGGSAEMRLLGHDANYNPLDLNANAVAWSVSPATAGQMVGNRFVVKAAGLVQITARVGTFTATSTVRVIKPAQITIAPNTLSMTPGLEQPLTILAMDADGWSSSVPLAEVRWSLSPQVGVIDGGTFVATSSETAQAKLRAEWAGLSAEIPILGLRELVLDEFNDESVKRSFTFYPQNVQGSSILGSIRLSGAGEPRYEGGSGKLSYYFPKQPNTRAAYLSYGEQGLALPQGVQAIKLWVNGRMIYDQIQNGQLSAGQWLRMQLTDASGSKQVLDLDRNVNWSDWRQLTATIPADWPQPLRLDRIYVAETD